MPIKKALKNIDKKALIKNLVNTGKWTKTAIDTAFSRGKISTSMAPEMEKFTSISAKFWLMPETYDMKGDRI